SFSNPDPYVAKDAYMAFGNPAALNLTGIITMEAWVKWTRRDKHRIIICHGGAVKPAAVNETVLRIGETLDYRAGVWTGKDHYAASVVPPSDSGVWVHLGGVNDGAAWTLYRNGEKVASLASDTGAMPSTGGWRIGAEFATIGSTTATGVTRYFSGSLDEVRIASVARSADWFKLAYATQKDGQTAVKWSGATGVRLSVPVGRMRSGGLRAGLWTVPKAGKTGLIDASGALLPVP
ncbi:MAG: LamG domain-containing protein, partial [Fibrobacteres bacterium]|nr:LamG domain-containing protein [Fibrobacterota bacterium]